MSFLKKEEKILQFFFGLFYFRCGFNFCFGKSGRFTWPSINKGGEQSILPIFFSFFFVEKEHSLLTFYLFDRFWKKVVRNSQRAMYTGYINARNKQCPYNPPEFCNIYEKN